MGTKYFEPRYDYWRTLDTLTIWEAVVLMYGVEPAVFGDFVVPSNSRQDEVGISPDLDEYRRLLTSAVLSGRVPSCNPSEKVSDATHVRMSDLVPWLQAKNFKQLASQLTPDSGGVSTAQPRPNTHVYRHPSQENTILETLEELGHDHYRLPENEPGKPGVKRAVRDRLEGHPDFAGSTTFDKAWGRLLAAHRITYVGYTPK